MKNQDKIFQTIEQIEHLMKESPEECLKLAESISGKVSTIKNETVRARFYYKLGLIFSDLNKHSKAIKFIKQALSIYERFGEKTNIIQCYYFIGNFYMRLNDFNKAKEYLTLSYNAGSETGNETIKQKSAVHIGRIYNEMGNYDKALDILFQSLEVSQKKNDKRNIAATLNHLGIIFTNLELYDKSIDYHIKALEIYETLNEPKLLASICNNIAVVYQYSDNYDQALEYYFKSLKIREEENDIRLIPHSLNNIGEVYEKQKKYELALDFFLKAKSQTDNSDEYTLSVVLFNLGKVYTKLKKYDKVSLYLNEAIELSERINVKAIKIDIYEGAKDIYIELKEYQKAFEYQEKYYKLKESTLNSKTARKIIETHSRNLNEVTISEDSEKQNNFPEIIGYSKEIEVVFSLINSVAEHNVNVLITGSTGSGKELVAKAIHNKYKKESPFVAINCSAIPEHLLESELFGYAKGAFTGAVKDKKGKIEMANKGTLFLDEIGDMPLSLQSKLLRVIQERTVTPIGSAKPIHVSIRIISATHRNLRTMITETKFRQDLFYRLNVIKIEIPDLKDRKLDIPFLVNHFIRKYNAKFGKKIRSISIDALNYLLSLSWQGNVRELENEIEKAVLLCVQDELNIDLFIDKLKEESENIFENLPLKWVQYKIFKNDLNNKLDTSYVKELLTSTNNNVMEASKYGGLDRAQIYRLLKKENKITE